jgi:hypothetical protein
MLRPPARGWRRRRRTSGLVTPRGRKDTPRGQCQVAEVVGLAAYRQVGHVRHHPAAASSPSLRQQRTRGALLSSDDYGSRVERGGSGQVLWRVHMRAADASAERRGSVVSLDGRKLWLMVRSRAQMAEVKRCRRWRMLLMGAGSLTHGSSGRPSKPAAAADAPQLTSRRRPCGSTRPAPRWRSSLDQLAGDSAAERSDAWQVGLGERGLAGAAKQARVSV